MTHPESREQDCGAKGSLGHTCTRPAGHHGDHQEIREGRARVGWSRRSCIEPRPKVCGIAGCEEPHGPGEHNAIIEARMDDDTVATDFAGTCEYCGNTHRLALAFGGVCSTRCDDRRQGKADATTRIAACNDLWTDLEAGDHERSEG